jgi:hypothetical protein
MEDVFGFDGFVPRAAFGVQEGQQFLQRFRMGRAN